MPLILAILLPFYALLMVAIFALGHAFLPRTWPLAGAGLTFAFLTLGGLITDDHSWQVDLLLTMAISAIVLAGGHALARWDKRNRTTNTA